MPDTQTEELILVNQRLLDTITKADWAAYKELCDPSITCFEPEANGRLVEGLEFHEFYFKLGGVKGNHNTTKVTMLRISAWRKPGIRHGIKRTLTSPGSNRFLKMR